MVFTIVQTNIFDIQKVGTGTKPLIVDEVPRTVRLNRPIRIRIEVSVAVVPVANRTDVSDNRNRR